MIRIAKYEFLDKEQAETKINALGVETDENGNEYPTHKHTIVHLGHIVEQQGQYDEDGNETVAPVVSSKYHVDVLWKGIDDHPYGWKSYAVDISGDGVHSFLGLNYDSYKIS
jgi:hypothetical protein